jgi:hypothetical protein
MSQSDGAIRPWRQIARELATERNSQKILDLSKELNEALLAQGADPTLIEADPKRPSSSADGKTRND